MLKKTKVICFQTEAADQDPYARKNPALYKAADVSERKMEKKRRYNKSEVATGTDAQCGGTLIGYRRYYSKKLHRLGLQGE